MSSKNTKTAVVAAVVVLVIVLAILSRPRGPEPERANSPAVQATVIDHDTTIEGNYSVAAGKRTVLKNGAKLTVNGDLSVDGELGCDGGPVQVTVTGALHVAKTIDCQRKDASVSTQGVSIVAKGDVLLDASSVISSDGAVQLVDDAKKLATTPAQIDALFADAGKPTGGPKRVGPFIDKRAKIHSYAPSAAPEVAVSTMRDGDSAPFALVAVAHAAGTHTIKLHGTLGAASAKKPLPSLKPNAKKPPEPPARPAQTPMHQVASNGLTNVNFGGGAEIDLAGSIYGKDGADGRTDNGVNCNAQGDSGRGGERIFISGDNLVIGKLDVHLGNGGAGGDAWNAKNCDRDVTATGGAGGVPGNIKIVVSDSLTIVDAVTIYPGNGGSGGGASAAGKRGDSGCPGKNGYKAKAIGGTGGDSKQDLDLAGSIAGGDKITIDTHAKGGDGGYAESFGGSGGAGKKPGCVGGNGASGVAMGGGGGGSNGTGGNGGDVASYGGFGGAGGNCAVNGAGGGRGGNGGDASSLEGDGGAGVIALGKPGKNVDEIGGDGGKGGDGPGFGSGGFRGGPGGQDGENGEKACVEEQGQVEPPPPTSNASVTTANWMQPQSCPQYGSPKQCYGRSDDTCGGYENWAKSCATFVWNVNPCKDGKKVVGVVNSSCIYETGPVIGKADTTVADGQVTVDCTKFAAQFKSADCNCNNGITLQAEVQCK